MFGNLNTSEGFTEHLQISNFVNNELNPYGEL